MRSGCLSLAVRVGMVSVAAILAAVSAALVLSFAVSALGQPEGVVKIFELIVASAAGLAFFLVGRGIWRDLRGQRQLAGPEGNEDRADDEQR